MKLLLTLLLCVAEAFLVRQDASRTTSLSVLSDQEAIWENRNLLVHDQQKKSKNWNYYEPQYESNLQWDRQPPFQHARDNGMTPRSWRSHGSSNRGHENHYYQNMVIDRPPVNQIAASGRAKEGWAAVYNSPPIADEMRMKRNPYGQTYTANQRSGGKARNWWEGSGARKEMDRNRRNNYYDSSRMVDNRTQYNNRYNNRHGQEYSDQYTPRPVIPTIPSQQSYEYNDRYSSNSRYNSNKRYSNNRYNDLYSYKPEDHMRPHVFANQRNNRPVVPQVPVPQREYAHQEYAHHRRW